MRKFEDLRIWQEARSLIKEIYSETQSLKDFGFRDQMQRAAVSIMNNIAEGAEAGSDNMFVRYLKISKASCGELKSMLYLAEDLKYIDQMKSEELRKSTELLVGGLQKLIEYLNKSKMPISTVK